MAVTVPSADATADEVFSKFKQQTYSELVNRHFKGHPLAVRPVFLHSPHRVEALIFLLMISLMAYFLLQRLYRQSVPADAPQREHRMTTQRLLRAFQKYTLLLHHKQYGREIQSTRLTKRQSDILQRLGFRTPAELLECRLPRAP
jgi:transposase